MYHIVIHSIVTHNILWYGKGRESIFTPFLLVKSFRRCGIPLSNAKGTTAASGKRGETVMMKKSLIMLICAVLVLTSAAFGTIAYLTAQEDVTNTFTMGDVDITVDETEVDEDGNPVLDEDDNTKRTDEGNEYRLVPGKFYTKDPTLTIKANSEDCYARLLVTYTNASELDAIFPAVDGVKPVYLVKDLNTESWVRGEDVADTTANTITFVFTYKNEDSTDIAATGETDNVLPALFTQIEVPAALTGEQLETLEGLEINAKGQAIQAFSFENAADAWAQFESQNP